MNYAFNQTGLDQLLHDIYRQNDALLSETVLKIEKNFRLYVTEQFLLTNSQIKYLSQLDGRLIKKLAAECAYFIAKRKPIQLVKSTVPVKLASGYQPNDADTEPGDRGKLFKLHRQSIYHYSLKDGFWEEETLFLIISYNIA